ncbi:MAG: hypothetical protein KJO60_04150, partial [Desulfofustis sp.]|nr:hypothetical protein [Desulfofustis sp.]
MKTRGSEWDCAYALPSFHSGGLIIDPGRNGAMTDSGLIRRYPDFFVSEIHQEILWIRFSG